MEIKPEYHTINPAERVTLQLRLRLRPIENTHACTIKNMIIDPALKLNKPALQYINPAALCGKNLRDT